MASPPSAPKSAPVLLPNAKKPSLLMRLFSTERKSSLYVMPTQTSPIDDGDPFVDGEVDDAAACRKKRHTKRLQSVDSATMKRDREALLNEQRQPQRHQSHRTRSSPDRGAKQSSAAPVRTSSAAVGEPRVNTKQPTTKVETRPKTIEVTSAPTEALSQPDGAPKTPKSRSPSTPTSPGAGSNDSQQPSSPSVNTSKNQSQPQRAGTKSSSKKSPEVGSTSKVAPLLPSAPPMSQEDSVPAAAAKKRQSISGESSASAARAHQQNQRQRSSRPANSSKSNKGNRKLKHRKKKSPEQNGDIKVDTSKPLDFPTTPDIVSEYHRQKPFLNRNEEWLIVELLEYECLIDGLEIIRIIAKHSKFFELEPDELWEEFFEFVENVPSYDEIINYDVWQEFLLEKYNC